MVQTTTRGFTTRCPVATAPTGPRLAAARPGRGSAEVIDEDLQAEIAAQLPKDISHIFISSVANFNIMQLKDMIWEKLNAPV